MEFASYPLNGEFLEQQNGRADVDCKKEPCNEANRTGT